MAALVFSELGDGGGAAAAERSGDRFGGQDIALVDGVEGGAEVLTGAKAASGYGCQG